MAQRLASLTAAALAAETWGAGSDTSYDTRRLGAPSHAAMASISLPRFSSDASALIDMPWRNSNPSNTGSPPLGAAR